MYVKEIYVHPVKSFGGVKVEESEVDEYGFKHDRRFMVCEADKNDATKLKFLTQREYPQFTLVECSIDEDKNLLTLSYPPENMNVSVPLVPSDDVIKKCPVEDTLIWGEYPKSIDLGKAFPEVGPFLAAIRGKDAKSSKQRITLVYHHLPRGVRRGLTPEDRKTIDRSYPQSSYQDYYPGNLINEKSLWDLDKRVQETTNGEVRLAPRNFRPNMVIADIENAWDEDHWKRVQIGEHEWIVACRNGRCQVTTVNLKEGRFERTHEPLKTMQKFRRIDPGLKYTPCFGMNLVQVDSHSKVRVGDKLTVLSTGEHYYPAEYDFPDLHQKRARQQKQALVGLTVLLTVLIAWITAIRYRLN
ncbi:hypothetical protein TRICI_006044 [Trichomonascus ciferrii]|uniref:MOSC domain-containing protein n=1 Tax=Trichomonascus ciferrii TaxID=44093 RepID=A0A642UMA9_9ASCO|nr:hypothetical protein TRICI_006044 [Trichomonascus ciferrii]